jgi:hypothetical protein
MNHGGVEYNNSYTHKCNKHKAYLMNELVMIRKGIISLNTLSLLILFLCLPNE